MVAGKDRRIAGSQLQGQLWIALEVHAGWAPFKRNESEHLASDLEHRHTLAERVVLDRARQATTSVEHVISGHEVGTLA